MTKLEANPETKVWGTTLMLHRAAGVQVHLIQAKAGGYCSIHRHNKKWNSFHVISGLLEVQTFEATPQSESSSYRPDKIASCRPNQQINVAPGELHQFRAVLDTVAIEIYWPEDVDLSDIERLTEGGITS